MPRRYRFFVALLLSVALPPAGAADRLRIGVLYWSMNIPGQVAMRAGLEAEARAINERAAREGLPAVELLPFVAGDGAEGIERQIGQMRALVAPAAGAAVDLILVQPADNAALAGPLREANRADIPVVAYDQYISGGTLAAYLTSDNYQAGWLDGEYLASLFPEGRELRLVLVEYPHVSSTVERVDGFLDAFAAAGRTVRVEKSYEAVEPEGGRRAGRQLLADFPQRGSLDLLFAVNDGGGLAVVAELERAGRDEIAVATVDGDPAAVARIRAGGPLRIDAAQFCGPLGAAAMRAAYRLLTGKPVAARSLLPTFPVTAATVARYPGWAGPIPAPFAKPWWSREPLWSGALTEWPR